MQLYYFHTQNSHKPLAVARYLDSPVECILVDLSKGEHKQPDFLAINPNGKLPALADGDVKLWEAHSIMAYLAVKAGSDLWPGDPIEQVHVLKWLNWDTAHFSRHAARLWFENSFKQLIGRGDPDPAEVEEATGFFHQFAGVLDDFLKGRDYLVADRLTIADFGVATYLPAATQAKLPLDGYPEIQRWYATLDALDAWREPWPQQAAA